MIKRFFVFLFQIIALSAFAQSKNDPKPNWQNLDLKKDGVFGMSTEQAYVELLAGKPAVPVIVAVIDGGVDVNHEALKSSLWINKNEIVGNGLDDDQNGYIDDIHGWNFIGSAKGDDVQYDNLELLRLVRKLDPKYNGVLTSTKLSDSDRSEFELYRHLMSKYLADLDEAQMGFAELTVIKKVTEDLFKKVARENPTWKDFDALKRANDIEKRVLKIIKSGFDDGKDYKKISEEITDGFKYYTAKVEYHLNMDYDPRSIVGDNYADSKERIYGNSDVAGPDATHGTHVSGIIAASRSGSASMLGIADQAHIMAIRVVPDGDERDKDVANGIRYATDNGAKVINMSFGKGYAWDKKAVDEAVQYALSKDVLLIHAAGNDGKDTDLESNFPNRRFVDSLATVAKGLPDAWIEVGASGWKDDDDLIASFSNYGKKSVDVFAPGVKIKSTVPGSTYKEMDGTSMAAPAVAGVAALIRAYYPKLTAAQVKHAIMNSVSPVKHKLKIKGNGESKRVSMSDICVSGGVVNTYKALQLAAGM